jgi:hypothetical protein
MVGEISKGCLSELQELDVSVARQWKPLSRAQKQSLWLNTIEERFAASNNGDSEAFLWAKISRRLLSKDPAEKQPTTEPLMKSINAELRGLPEPSQYRDYAATSADLTFAPPELIGPELRKLKEACAEISPPLVRIALFAQEFLSIHPFQDGNGRTARLITDLLLKDADYPPPHFSSPLDFMIARRWNKPPLEGLEHSVLIIAGAVERGICAEQTCERGSCEKESL